MTVCADSMSTVSSYLEAPVDLHVRDCDVVALDRIREGRANGIKIILETEHGDVVPLADKCFLFPSSSCIKSGIKYRNATDDIRKR